LGQAGKIFLEEMAATVARIPGIAKLSGHFRPLAQNLQEKKAKTHIQEVEVAPCM
jgi:hypothetical protein